ncbi:MAG: ATP-binding protein [Rhodoglobus sp.]
MTVVVIDGRSGSGKTELARAFVAAHPEFQLVPLDDFYAGWDGLEQASADLPRILTEGSWQSWDWSRNDVGHRRTIDVSKPVLVEGAGSLTRATRPLADLAVWVELSDEQRKHRALARDGDTYEPHWDRWAKQELHHLASEHPEALADVVVDGTDALVALRVVDAALARIT